MEMVGGGEYAWVPITKFDDIESYRKWAKERREEMRKEMGLDRIDPLPGVRPGRPKGARVKPEVKDDDKEDPEAAEKRPADRGKAIKKKAADRSRAKLMRISLTASAFGQLQPSFLPIYHLDALMTLHTVSALRGKR